MCVLTFEFRLQLHCHIQEEYPTRRYRQAYRRSQVQGLHYQARLQDISQGIRGFGT